MKRTASTLIEVALSLPILTMLLVLAISGVQQVMRVSRLAKDRGQVAYTLSRLEQSFRTDAHQADSVQLQPDDSNQPPSIRMTMSNANEIVYRSKQNRVEREHIHADGTSSSESFALFSENQVDFAVENANGVSMTIRRVHREHADANRLELFVRSKIGRQKGAQR